VLRRTLARRARRGARLVAPAAMPLDAPVTTTTSEVVSVSGLFMALHLGELPAVASREQIVSSRLSGDNLSMAKLWSPVVAR